MPAKKLSVKGPLNKGSSTKKKDDTQLVTGFSESPAGKPGRGMTREGYTKVHTAPKDIQDAIVSLYNQGYSISAISTILGRDYDYHVTPATLSSYIDKRHEEIGRYAADTEEYASRVRDEFANVMSGLQFVQRELRKKFKEAVEAGSLKEIEVYGRMITQNVETACKILDMPVLKQKKNKSNKSFGQLLEEIPFKVRGEDD